MQQLSTDLALNEYLAECEELLQNTCENLARFEQGLFTSETLDLIYRNIHTIKGSSQLFGFSQIGEIAHFIETGLDPIRKNKIHPSAMLVEVLFASMDLMDQMTRAIKSGSKEDFSIAFAKIAPRIIDSSVRSINPNLNSQFRLLKHDFISHTVFKDKSLLNSIQKQTSGITHSSHQENEQIQSPRQEMTGPPMPVQSDPKPLLSEANALPVSTKPQALSSNPVTSSDTSETASTIRVSVALLDKLMTLMGEMVLARNQVLQYANKIDDLEFLNLSQRLDVVTSEIQGEVMKTRMQPIGNVLSKFQRVVRDLSKDLNKKIDLQLIGMETELDKTLLEAVKDPIMHIVRNSCDHGLEGPEDRKLQNKKENGTITIRSYHEGGQVIVEISDDGRGLNKDKLISKAIEKNLITAEKAALMTEQEAYSLIFAPGFSTAAQVTNVSGRGVGMDVVKNNLEKIGGVVDLHSTLGKGTVTRLKIPLTLAIVPAMIVRVGKDRFAIPQVKLVELVRVEKNKESRQIELLQGKAVYRLRDKLLCLVSLSEVLGISGETEKNQGEPSFLANDVTNIIVLSAEKNLFGLVVDEVQDTADIVVKALSPFLKSLSVYSGATVLGDGSVAIILDVNGIASKEHFVQAQTSKDSRTDQNSMTDETSEQQTNELQEFLLFRLNSPTRHAIPLNLVHRLEEFKRELIEYSGDQRVIRYRDTILPIISLNQFFKYEVNNNTDANLAPVSASETISIIVCKKAGIYYGIEVNEILDVFTTTESLDDSVTNHPSYLGNLLDVNKIIVVIDALYILDALQKGTKKSSTSHDEDKTVNVLSKRRILFAEDTVFFKKHVTAVLEREGLHVTHAENGAKALALLEKSEKGHYDLILSDIEMPKMTGLEFAQAVRASEKWKHLPMIAITTRYESRHIEEGIQAGFNAYLEKLNAEALLSEIKKLITQGSKV